MEKKAGKSAKKALFRQTGISYCKLLDKESAMYLFTAIFLFILLFFFCIGFCRRKKIIKKICCMSSKEKCETLNQLLAPFGYCYVPSQDIISSRTDAWQREFGYHALFDKAASYAGMIMDCLPVYFNYQDRTWLIEFWKGQYGISTGCEIGVYYAERILDKEEYTHTLFQCVDDDDMPQLAFTLCRDSKVIAELCERHWWLTAFLPGLFSAPTDLCMHISVTLPSHEMAEVFVDGLLKAGYNFREICLCHRNVTFTFANITPPCGIFRKLWRLLVQFFNRMWCRVFLFLTRPFCLRVDRILYLYYFLPFAFRNMLHLKKDKKRRTKQTEKGAR